MEQNTKKAISWTVGIIVLLVVLTVASILIVKHEHAKTSGQQAQNNPNVIKHQEYTQTNATPGTVIAGFPQGLIPAGGATVTSSYHNQYNGLDQYTVNLSAPQVIDDIYGSYTQYFFVNGFTVTDKGQTPALDNLTATNGNATVTVSIQPARSKSGQPAEGSTVAISYSTH